MANRLAAETSPYLKQHAHNPVDWYPWGPEAFEKARREDKPVFLSIGYSSCHWCHVMERESFESEDVARLLNGSWVSIKVDREERPDVDDVYMTAVQLTTGRGGWPLSAFLLPDGRPFFGGTYFPPEDRHGRAGFRTLLTRLAEAWRTRRAEVEESAAQLAAEIASSADVTSRGAAVTLSSGTLPLLTQALRRSFDGRLGGFGGAPKFPPHLALEWLLGKGVEGDSEALSMATVTLDAMALGGIHDHLGGGFHRYSTDAEWLVPHFEKMLTDNAQLLGLYARAFAATGRDLYRGTARDTGDYLLREMRGPEGGFYAATDADSEGEEGKYFVFSEREIRDVLGENDRGFLERYGVRPGGNFHDEASGRATGLNILHLSFPLSFEEDQSLEPLRRKLLEFRSSRVPPGLDDKRVAGWNALAVSGFAIASRALNEPRYLEAARTGARFLLGSMRDGTGRLLRTWKDGEGKIPAFLEDEAFLANALLDLSEADEGDGASAWLQEAKKAVEGMRRRFRRKDGPGFTFTGEGHEELLMRGRDLFDKAIPSASGSAALSLVHLARKTGDAALAREARDAIEEVSWLMSRSPHGTESWFLALADLLEFEKERGGTKERSAEKERQAGPDAALIAGGREQAGAAVSSKGRSDREDAARDGGGGAGTGPSSLSKKISASDPLRVLHVEAECSPGRVRRGERFSLSLKIAVAEGWYLAGSDGLAIEVWAGSDVPVEETAAPRLTPISKKLEKETGDSYEMGYEGTVSASFSLLPSRNAALGERVVSVLVRYRPCGEGACRPEASLSLMVPVVVF